MLEFAEKYLRSKYKGWTRRKCVWGKGSNHA
nr:MAG TPA: hypothetical protein [Caudoviricetes sp.]DAJ43837.1 MAG TPA: hypothetical protein [Caudoviricetes sp.]